ncbi:hypothetical protein COU61_01435 [Candidatus Pacearchaeota archaeon CG10_big_fil_rev_8_21_14_0_10_35_13]|nr:MAG: hypothetical protein COU61_01435 [Candidatus Pacearchaeota archaeon CG10_big_fil_rev_8_21_14_0_10_35_13]
MKKREFTKTLLSLVVISMLILGVGAQETTGSQIQEDNSVQLEVKAGITPDSPFYFLDDLFGGSREEKIAEIKQMIEEGNIEAARKALVRYKEYADRLEKEVNPEGREEARRSATAIRNALREVETQIPDGDREEFFNEIIDKEEKIVTSAEIAEKINELCKQLDEMGAYEEYSRLCKTDDDENAPGWKKNLDKKLTTQQEENVKTFANVMKSCFETSGQDCPCEKIPHEEFAIACAKAAPLAVKCDKEGNEQACEELDNLEMPELPDYLEKVWLEIQGGMKEAQFDMHMPKECVEAGAKDPKDCQKIMITTNAPEECREALLNANLKNEYEGRKICDKIMFEKNAPEECKQAGINNFEECGTYMFEQNAPRECIEAGITGKNRNDDKKCREIMENMNQQGIQNMGPEERAICESHEIRDPRDCKDFLIKDGRMKEEYKPEMEGFAGGCGQISDPMKRLECYDNAGKGIGQKHDEFQGRMDIPIECKSVGALSKEACEKHMRDAGQRNDQEGGQCLSEEEARMKEEGCKQCPTCEPRRNIREGCVVMIECINNNQGMRPEYEEGEGPNNMPENKAYREMPEYQEERQEYQQPMNEENQDTPTTPTQEVVNEPTQNPTPIIETSPVTGGFIIENSFYNYYYRR